MSAEEKVVEFYEDYSEAKTQEIQWYHLYSKQHKISNLNPTILG